MSAVELLREAAKTMRQRANAATPGPWQSDGSEVYGQTPAIWVGETLKNGNDEQTNADSGHIASWHPAVALAVADWLDAEADTREVLAEPYGNSYAVVVARAYLGRPQ